MKNTENTVDEYLFKTYKHANMQNYFLNIDLFTLLNGCRHQSMSNFFHQRSKGKA